MDSEKDFQHFSWLHLAVADKGLINFNLKPINCTVSLHMHILGWIAIDKKEILYSRISYCRTYPVFFAVLFPSNLALCGIFS